MKKTLVALMLGLVSIMFIGCSTENSPSEPVQLVEVTLHFGNKLPDQVVQFDILLVDDTLVSGEIPQYGYYTQIYRKDMTDNSITVTLDANPTYFNVPYATGKYQVQLNRSDGHYYSILPELELDIISKYTKLEYTLQRIEDSWDPDHYYDRGFAHYTLISSEKK